MSLPLKEKRSPHFLTPPNNSLLNCIIKCAFIRFIMHIYWPALGISIIKF